MNHPGTEIADIHLADRLVLRVEVMAEIEDQEVRGVVTELDPLHLQIPLAHHLPEDLEGDVMLQSPHVAALPHLGADAPLHLYHDHVLAQ